MTGASTGTFTVIEHDEDEGDRTLGTVTLDGEGRLDIVGQGDDPDDRLSTVVEEMNAEEQMHVEAPPPAGARPFEVFTRIVPRGTDGFVPAMLEHMRRYYDIELRPA